VTDGPTGVKLGRKVWPHVVHLCTSFKVKRSRLQGKITLAAKWWYLSDRWHYISLILVGRLDHMSHRTMAMLTLFPQLWLTDLLGLLTACAHMLRAWQLPTHIHCTSGPTKNLCKSTYAAMHFWAYFEDWTFHIFFTNKMLAFSRFRMWKLRKWEMQKCKYCKRLKCKNISHFFSHFRRCYFRTFAFRGNMKMRGRYFTKLNR